MTPDSTPSTQGAIDWSRVRQRMDDAASAVGISATRSREVLEERARLLARQPAPPVVAALEVVSFTLKKEVYAVETRFVVAMFQLGHLAPLPGAEPPICGLTSWRGELLTLLDLCGVLGLSAPPLDNPSRVLVLGDERPEFGVLVTDLRELTIVPNAAIRMPEGAESRTHLLGITREGMVVLDAQVLLRRYAGLLMT